ncbi:hypothetical protein TWF730_002989 [Orbilia blumenaviensis]|uniref:NFX1-type zinc finger-containing protein 1 n=1 Tax=Orbilia blumenaviensis TaxID=1796055 RepID=A0AAV9U9Y7_9PEZI
MSSPRICFQWRKGNCRRGPKCKYAHQENLAEACRDFQRNKNCRRGDNCTYGHFTVSTSRRSSGAQALAGRSTIPSTTQSSSQNTIAASLTQATTTASSTVPTTLESWKRICRNRGTYSPIQMKTFLEGALVLITSKDIGTAQEVIKGLADENNLKHIQQLLEADFTYDGTSEELNFVGHIIPFLKVVTNHEFQTSIVIERYAGTIYNVIYGVSGTRGVQFFERVLSRSRTLMTNNPDDYLETFPMIISALKHTIQLNSSAMVQEGVKKVAREALTQANEQNLLVNPEMRPLHQNFKIINEQLALGEQIPSLIPTKPKSNEVNSIFSSFASWLAGGSKGIAHPTLHPAIQAVTRLPGTLSELGPRHDNDHASITDIHILPTPQEIRSTEAEYLPRFGGEITHLDRNQKLLDTQFRLLREDSIGCLREALRQVIENRGNLAALRGPRRKNDGVKRYFTAGVAVLIHQNVQVEYISLSPRHGLKIGITFDQPIPFTSNQERREWWGNEDVLSFSSLVCILNEENEAVFFTVADRYVTQRDISERDRDEIDEDSNQTVLTLADDQKRAGITICFANVVRETDVVWLSKLLTSSAYSSKIDLVEFPKTLLASFRPILQGLQKRFDNTQGIPFIDWLAPDPSLDYQPCADDGSKVQVKPPVYASRPGFFFDLSSIFTTRPATPVRLYPAANDFDMQNLLENTSLDEGQAQSLVKALSREVGLIQGPPGTGKSFVGTKIVKVLLANKTKANLGPVVCVCYTNHALDQFLEHLLDIKIGNIVRLGSRSKSERLEKCLLKNLVRSTDNTKVENSEMWETRSTIRTLVSEAADYCRVLLHPESDVTFRTHIQDNYPHFFKALFVEDVDDEGFIVQHGNGKQKPFQVWKRKARLGTINRSVRSILNTTENPWTSLTPFEINAVLTFWRGEIRQNAIAGLADVAEQHRVANEKLSTLRKERDRRLLQAADIIGVTTSGLAAHADMLERVDAKVLFCEEAGEILEAHTITALIPSIVHMILIGDHEQLRPHVANYDLSTESKKGQAYNLDVSLFERLVRQPYGNVPLKFPIASLNTQRRMHTSIADLIRLKTYPGLLDKVPDYPSIPGMKKRLFWMNHMHMDSKGDAVKATTSYTNDFEQEMVLSLVTHLLHQGVFKEKQIAVLTPYLGQMSKLRRILGNTLDIVVGSRDQQALDEAAEFLEEEEKQEEAPPPSDVVRKSSLAAAVRIATIDNFQGEEADVVIISLVRSNKDHQCGFLKTSNRINVLLSRAKWGMYIIGDANTAGSVPMWADVINQMNINGCLGDTLELQCDRHSDVTIHVACKDDFNRFSPEGGCDRRCEWRLKCGHACISKCHSSALHKLTICFEPCPRQLVGCDHPCTSKCGQPCGPCTAPIRGVLLKCGHTVTQMRCSQYQKLSEYFCRARVQKKVPGCNHEVTVECGRDIHSANFNCPSVCGADLNCGHSCKNRCMDCRKPSKNNRQVITVDHGKCSQKCGRPFNTCSHSCEQLCHDGEDCSSCKRKCEIRCAHSKCDGNCRDPCQPCAEQCILGCEHQKCLMPCGVSCNILPCDKVCSKLLECGHQCPSLCGEKCPDKKFCRECGSDEVKDFVVDMLMFETYRNSKDEPIVFLPCGHYYTVSTFDGVAHMKDFFEFDDTTDWKITGRYLQEKSAPEIPKCPGCRAPYTTSARYNEVVKKSQLQNCIRQFTLASHSTLVALIQKVNSLQDELEKTRDSFVPTTDLGKRYADSVKLAKEISKYNTNVTKEEQPYHRVYELTVLACRNHGISVEDYNPSVVQYRFGIEGAYQELRVALSRVCDMDIIAARISTAQELKKRLWQRIVVITASAAEKCLELVETCKERKNQLIEVQARIAFAKFLTMHTKHRDEIQTDKEKLSDSKVAGIKAYAIEDLEGCLEICNVVPSCKNLIPEIKETIRSIKGGTFYSAVTNKEMREIYDAMTREFGGTGHWYVCPNGHQFTVGECGQPMRVGVCNECGAQIGGQSHVPVAGVSRDTNLDARMRQMTI